MDTQTFLAQARKMNITLQCEYGVLVVDLEVLTGEMRAFAMRHGDQVAVLLAQQNQEKKADKEPPKRKVSGSEIEVVSPRVFREEFVREKGLEVNDKTVAAVDQWGRTQCRTCRNWTTTSRWGSATDMCYRSNADDWWRCGKWVLRL